MLSKLKKSISKDKNETHIEKNEKLNVVNDSQYKYIIDFDNTTEELCKEADEYNLELYKKNCELYNEISTKLIERKALFKVESPPQQPSNPNNYQRYIDYKIRNISKNVRHQSFAIHYLLNKNYRLVFDPSDINSERDFESYTAIELVEKISGEYIEQLFKKTYPNINHHISVNRKTIYNQYYDPSLYMTTTQPSAPPTYLTFEYLSDNKPSTLTNNYTHVQDISGSNTDISNLSSSPINPPNYSLQNHSCKLPFD